ncbi:MAG: nucleotidyltransferase family protein [Oscillospiraceae bacterium]|nr:nucleotidyltransferase family protein [Oscillospiraceae bacterium]
MVGCVLMAAGIGSRFGGDKLQAELGGRTLVLRAMDAIPPELKVVVVTGSASVAGEAKLRSFPIVWNDRPQDGLSRTVRLGTEALRDCDAILYLVADQPLLRRDSVRQVLELYARCPDCICAAGSDGRHGNPCLFPWEFFGELEALTGDCGGSTVIHRHADRLRVAEIPACQLTDVDTKETLVALREEK